jgi:hypothetical protein
VETIIQEVSPLFGTGAGAATGAASAAAAGAAAGAAASAGADAAATGASAAGAAVWAKAKVPAVNKPRPKARDTSSFFIFGLSFCLQRFFAGFAGTNTHNLFDVIDKNLAIADFSGARCTFNGFNHTLNQRIINCRFNFHFRQKIDNVLCTAIQLCMALLASEAFDFSDSYALYTNAGQGFTHLIELERFNDGRYEFHGFTSA